MQLAAADSKRKQTIGEEVLNSISHGLGLIAAIAGSPYLIVHAVRYGDAGFIVGASIFSATMILLYFASTLYHALPTGKAKRAVRTIEHSAIYLLIAGTVTPFTLGILSGALGWSLFGIVWGLAALGVTLKATGKMSHPILSVGLYLLMGWIIVIAVDPLMARMPKAGWFWLVAGGMFYTVGVAFYATDTRLKYGHLIWHLFVLAGTASHYFVVLWYASGHLS